MTCDGCLVLGIGNLLLSDEGVGIHVVRALENVPLPPHVCLMDGGTGGFSLIPFFQDYEHVVIVDAAIDRRCEAMLAAGWLGEVEKLRRAGYDARHKAMRSLGYHQLLGVAEGRTDLPAAAASIKAETRRYARRQRTYFRHQLPAPWRVDIDDPAATPWDAIGRFLAGGSVAARGGAQ